MKKVFLLIFIIYIFLLWNNNVYSEENIDNQVVCIELNSELLGDNNYLLNQIYVAIKDNFSKNPGTIQFDLKAEIPYDKPGGGVGVVEVRGNVYLQSFTTLNGTNMGGWFNNQTIAYYLIQWNICDEFTEEVKQCLNAGVEECYPDAILLSDASVQYNCHSYAWYRQDTGNNYIWLQWPNEYYSTEDGSYVEVAVPRIGDIICYYDSDADSEELSAIHSGIIVDYSGENESNGVCGDANKYIVHSKWGFWGLYEHRGDQCTDATGGQKNDADYVKYYRLNTNDQSVISDTNDFNRNNIIIQAKSSTVSRDQTVYACELNFTYSGNHNITITSDVALNTTLWNVWRDNYGLICNEVINEEGQYIYTYSGLFDAGYYYLRAECVNEDDIANISVSVSQHEHAYINYTDLGDGTHKNYCDCGVFVIEDHEISCEDDNNSASHTYSCVCGMSVSEEHDYGFVSKNGTEHTYACSCGSTITNNGHTYSHINYSDTQHKVTCPCGEIKFENHDYSTYLDYSDTQHKVTCPCGEIKFENHDYSTYLDYSDTHHYSVCRCGAHKLNMHVIKSDSAIGRYRPCTFCGHLIDTVGENKFPIIHNKFENEETE